MLITTFSLYCNFYRFYHTFTLHFGLLGIRAQRDTESIFYLQIKYHRFQYVLDIARHCILESSLVRAG